jgi:Ran GTPase-activating protein (RanGAP) involved in mRNA processing and transport
MLGKRKYTSDIQVLIDELLEVFRDPITHEINHPRYSSIGPDGHMYNRVAIEHWTRQNKYTFKSPLTNEEYNCRQFSCFTRPSTTFKKTYDIIRQYTNEKELIESEKNTRKEWFKSKNIDLDHIHNLDKKTEIELIFHNYNLRDTDVVFIADEIASSDLPILKELKLSLNEIGDDGMKVFSTVVAGGALVELEILDLASNRIGGAGMTALALAARKGLGSLADLRLSFNHIGDEGMQALSSTIATKALGNLHYLWLEKNNIGDNGMVAFADALKSTPGNPSGALPNLEKLSLFSNVIGDAGLIALADAVKPSPANPRGALAQLTHFNLGTNQIGDSGMQSFASAVISGALEQLTHLTLGGNRIGDAGLTAFASASPILVNLNILDLDENQISDPGMVSFSEDLVVYDKYMHRGALPHLTHIYLRENEIGDVGMQAFSDAIRSGALASLKFISLAKNVITEAGMQAFSDVIRSGAPASLNTLYVDNGKLGNEHPALKAACQARNIRLVSYN